MERCDTQATQDPDDLRDDATFGGAWPRITVSAGLASATRLAARLRAEIAANHSAATPPESGMEVAATVLWSRFLRYDVADPSWTDRDRFVLSSGRFGPLLRALLQITGHGTVPPGCAFGQHPAVETASGPPGQGFATAVGMAVAERALAGRFGRTLVDHRTWVMACETDLTAGVSLEAAALAGQMHLEKLVVLSDAVAVEAGNGPDAMTRFAASGWAVRRVNRDDPEAIAGTIARAMRNRRPTLIACQPGQDVRVPDPHVPNDPAAQGVWIASGQRGAGTRRSWLRRLARHRLRAEFERSVSGRLPVDWERGWRHGWLQPSLSHTHIHDTARHGLALLCGLLPEVMTLHSRAGAGLAASLPDLEATTPVPGRAGRHRHLACGVQEHGMAALTNGLSLHGGSRPVLSASVVSIDRMRPALRLAALMGQPVVYLLSDDRLQPDTDGAGWQPVEQLASLRAMPEVAVFRPADPEEMVTCWTLALRRDTGPSLIALSSEASPATVPHGPPAAEADRRGIGSEDRARGCASEDRARGCARGGYIRAEADGPRHATLIATGPEVAVALEARKLLHAEGIAVAIVSLPCWELFAAQSASYRAEVLGEVPRFGIEAASGFGWERWLGTDGIFIGMDGFGASAPAGAYSRHAGITPDAVAGRVRRHLAPQQP